MPNSKRCQYSDLTDLHSANQNGLPKFEWEWGSWKWEGNPSEKTHMGWETVTDHFLGWQDNGVPFLMLSSPLTTRTLDLPLLPLLWDGLTTPVIALPHVWGLCWPLLLLTCCGKAPSVLTAGQHPSEPSELQQPGGRMEAEGRMRSYVRPWCLFCILHMPGCWSAHVKTSTISHQGYKLPQHCSKEENKRSLGSHYKSQKLLPSDNIHHPSLLHLFISPPSHILPLGDFCIYIVDPF